MALLVNANPGYQPFVSLIILFSCCLMCVCKIVRDKCVYVDTEQDDEFKGVKEFEDTQWLLIYLFKV